MMPGTIFYSNKNLIQSVKRNLSLKWFQDLGWIGFCKNMMKGTKKTWLKTLYSPRGLSIPEWNVFRDETEACLPDDANLEQKKFLDDVTKFGHSIFNKRLDSTQTEKFPLE